MRWIVIYPVDSAIHRLNNWGDVCTYILVIVLGVLLLKYYDKLLNCIFKNVSSYIKVHKYTKRSDWPNGCLVCSTFFSYSLHICPQLYFVENF